MTQRTAVLYSPEDWRLPEALEMWLLEQPVARVRVRRAEDLTEMGMRSRPRFVLFDARQDLEDVTAAVAALKRDSYTGIVPSAVLVRAGARRNARRIRQRR